MSLRFSEDGECAHSSVVQWSLGGAEHWRSKPPQDWLLGKAPETVSVKQGQLGLGAHMLS